MSTRVEVATIPNCDLCGAEGYQEPAYADARLPMYGSWAFVCRNHFIVHSCRLGTGLGQELVARKAVT